MLGGGPLQKAAPTKTFQGKIWLRSLTDGDGAVARLHDDLDGAARSVFAFDVGVTGLRCGFVEIRTGKIRIDVAGVAIRRDLEAGVAGQAQRDFRGRIRQLNIVLGNRGVAHFDVSVAVVHADSAAGILYLHVALGRPQRQVAGGIYNFEIAGADFHVAGELSQREVRAVGDETHTLCNFFCTNGAVEFAVQGEAAGGVYDAHLTALARDFYVAFRIGDSRVATLRVNRNASASVRNFDVTFLGGDGDSRSQVRNVHVALFGLHIDVGLLWNADFQIETEARITLRRARGTYYVSVPILAYFHFQRFSQFFSGLLSPRFDLLLAGHPDLRLIRRP